MGSRTRGWRWLAGLGALVMGLCACWLAAPSGGPALADGTPTTSTAPSLLPTLTTQTTDTSPETVQVSVSPATDSDPLPVGFMGFSIETAALHAYLGRDPAALNPVFLQLLEGIDQGHPPVLRVGGDSSDDTWVQLPGVIPPLGVNYIITNDWIQTVAALSEATGTRLILGVNLAADDPQIASVEARTLVSGIPRHYIEALEIGNEPDLYSDFPWYYVAGAQVNRRIGNYSFPNYVAQLNEWREIMPKGIPLAAGALATLTWLPALSSTVSEDPDVAIVAQHRYALSACETNKNAADYADLANLLDSASTEGLASSVAADAAALHQTGRQLRVDELNTASCEGEPGVSNTFGSALWILNELFDMAAANVDGINVHTLPGSSYAPFTFTDTGGRYTATVNPIYYGMLMFGSAFPTGAELLSTSDSSSDVKAYTTEAPNGTLRTTIINENPNAAANVTLSLPGGPTSEQAETLTAPALDATSGVALGGQSFADPTSSGTLPKPSTTVLDGQNGSFSLSVPSDSAVLLTAS